MKNEKIQTFLAKPWIEDPAAVTTDLRLWKLIRHDPSGQLPLKKGGTTDIYADLREHRNSPGALRFLANLYCDGIDHLDEVLGRAQLGHIAVIAEVPVAMSTVVGVVADRLGRRILTVRDTPKPGRVHADYVGEIRPGDNVIILDDVITDGESKRQPIEVLRKHGVEPLAIMTLVDRDQGWRKSPDDTCFEGVPVWSGMSLATLRQNLRA